MLKPNTQKYKLLEMIGISGEFPASQLSRLFDTPAYTEKMITDLKANHLIRCHYKDGLRGYRLTKRAKEMLLSYNPSRFHCYLDGNVETNSIRSEPQRRIRLHQKAQTYLSLSHTAIPFLPDEKPPVFHENRQSADVILSSLPCFYSSREIKELGDVTTKIRNSRSVGSLLARHCVYCIYNTGSTVMKWEYRTEVRLTAFLQHYLKCYPYTGHPPIRAIMFGDTMDVALQLMTSTGGPRRDLFMLDKAFDYFHFLPSSEEGEPVLKLLANPELLTKLNQLLLSDQEKRRGDIPMEHDAISPDGRPTLLAYDFDMQRINRFNTGLNVLKLSGNVICFDFQIPVLEKYMGDKVQFSSIDLSKFRREFLHEL